MTLKHRNTFRRILKRQLNGLPPPGPDNGSGSDGNPAPSSSANPGSALSSSDPSSKPTNSSTPDPPTSPPSRPTPSSTSQNTLDSTDQATSSSSSTSTSSSSSSTDTSTSSTSSTSTSTSITSTSTVTRTAPVHIPTNSSATLTLPATVGSPSVTPSASASAAPSSGVSVGAIVGGIAGGIVGIAILGFLVSFILRRLHKRNRRDTIIGDEFHNSTFMVDNTTGSNGNNDDALEPPNMAQRTHSFAPSIASGPGMAGHGAYQSGAMYDTDARGGYGAAGYGAAAAEAALHERLRYAYGRQNPEEVDDMVHGVYSSQPQPQAPHNPEAYSSYAAYGSGAATGAGYQEATREYQGQQQHSGYTQGGYQSDIYGAHAGYGVAVADPEPLSSGATTAGAHPSVRDPATIGGNRGPNTRSVVQDEDVYGGI